MTAWAGKALLFAGCTALGLLAGLGLCRRTACLRDFRRLLADLARELAFSLRPLPPLMERAAGGDGPAAPLFAACCQRFSQTGRESWAESWRQALAETELPLEPEDLTLLAEAGEILGRWDGESQCRALENLTRRLEERAALAEERARRLFRVDVTLGLAAGLFCLLLL